MKIFKPKEWWLSRARAEPATPIGAGAHFHHGALEFKPTLRMRLAKALGFTNWARWPEHEYDREIPEGHDRITVTTLINLSLGDRLRVLARGMVAIETHTYVEVPIHKAETTSVAYIPFDVPR